jgi:hypothetical protein
MSAERIGQPTAGILISLDALVVQRTDRPAALDEAAMVLGRIGWIGRPVILMGQHVAGRDLPGDLGRREEWVRSSVGRGAYAVVPFDDPSTWRGGQPDQAADEWRDLRDTQHGTWLLTDKPRQVGPARQAGLKVILIGPTDAHPSLHRPDYQARDLRDAVGHLLAMDVFAGPPTANGGR